MKVSLICWGEHFARIRKGLEDYRRGADSSDMCVTQLSPVLLNFALALERLNCVLVHDDLDSDVAIALVNWFLPERLEEYKGKGIPLVSFCNYTPLLSLVCYQPFDRKLWESEKKKLETLLRLCDVILLETYAQLGDFQMIFHDLAAWFDPAKIRLIHLFADEALFRPDSAGREATRKELGIEGDDLLFMYHGRFYPILGLEVFAEGLRDSSNRHVKFLAVGEPIGIEPCIECYSGSVRDRLRKLSGGDGRFIFSGSKPAPVLARYLVAADFYVSHLSDHIKVQHFSRVGTFEAIGCGIPVLCSNTLGAHYFVKDRENGVILAPNDPKAVTRWLDCLTREEAVRYRRNMTEAVLREGWYFFKTNLPVIEEVFRTVKKSGAGLR